MLDRGGQVTAPAASGWTWAVFPPSTNGTNWPPLSWCPADLFSDTWLQSGLHLRDRKPKLSQSTEDPTTTKPWSSRNLRTSLAPAFLENIHMKNCSCILKHWWNAVNYLLSCGIQHAITSLGPLLLNIPGSQSLLHKANVRKQLCKLPLQAGNFLQQTERCDSCHAQQEESAPVARFCHWDSASPCARPQTLTYLKNSSWQEVLPAVVVACLRALFDT